MTTCGLNRDDAQQLEWYWKDKGDPSRWTGFEDACAKCSALKKAYDDWKAAEQVLELVIAGIGDTAIDEDDDP